MKKITNELIKKFRRYLIEEEKSAATVEKYIRDINVFADWLGEKELDKETVLTYKENLTKNYAPASVNSVLSSLNSFFTFNEWYNLRVKNLKIQKQIFANKDSDYWSEWGCNWYIGNRNYCVHCSICWNSTRIEIDKIFDKMH